MFSRKDSLFVIGLTGGIGSGKTTVANVFAALGVPVIDADVIARELAVPGQAAFREICEAFGETVVGPDGTLDRAALRKRVFENPQARATLEAILHPRIRQAMAKQFSQLQTPYGIACIPLLLETGQTDLVHRILVIDVPKKLQIRRVQARDGLSEPQIRAIIASQCRRDERLAAADDVLVNDQDPKTLNGKIEALHLSYLDRARTRRCHDKGSVGE